MSATPRLLDTTQAAEALGLAARTLETYRLSGRGPRFVKIGRRSLYAPEDLAAWVESRKRTSTKETEPEIPGETAV
jgi:predicted DNA-binding transcriptional regulator AlpA